MTKEGLWKDFFKIRSETTGFEKAILGIIPILLILLGWFLLTMGSVYTVQIPEGAFDDMEEAPPVGTIITDGLYMRLPGWEVISRKIETPATQEPAIQGDAVADEENSEPEAAPGLEIESEPEAEKFENFLVNSGLGIEVPLGGLRASSMGRNTRIRMPRGFIVSRSNFPLNIGPQDDDDSRSKAIEKTRIGSGGAQPKEPEKQQDSPTMIHFRYELVETRRIPPTTLPSPGEVIRSVYGLVMVRDLWTNLFNSFKRVSLGFITAVLIVFPLGVMMGTFKKVHALFSPLMVFGGYLPIPALVPLTLSFFGTDELQKVMFLAMAFTIYLLPLFVKAVEDVDNVFLLTAYTLGANRLQVLRHVLIAIAGPNMFDAMRMGFGVGWGYIILAEMVDMSARGVGALILTSQRVGPKEDIYLVLIAVVLLAFVTDKVWERVGYHLFPYRRQAR